MVNEAMLPRTAVREVEQRLTAAGCPDADFDARGRGTAGIDGDKHCQTAC